MNYNKNNLGWQSKIGSTYKKQGEQGSRKVGWVRLEERDEVIHFT